MNEPIQSSSVLSAPSAAAGALEDVAVRRNEARQHELAARVVHGSGVGVGRRLARADTHDAPIGPHKHVAGDRLARAIGHRQEEAVLDEQFGRRVRGAQPAASPCKEQQHERGSQHGGG